MKFLRTTLSIFLILGICLIIFRSDLLIQYGIVELAWSWMNSYLLPKGLLLILSAVLTWAVWPVFSSWKRFQFLGLLLVFGIAIGGYLLVNPPYIEWIKQGTDMTAELSGNPVEKYLNQNQPDFDGIICLALPGCPHCEVAISKLALMQKRVPEMDVMVFVFTEDSTKVNSFQKDTGVETLPFQAVPDPDDSIELCKGKFPTFLYFKNGKVIHRWFNWQFGYPAIDWVEAGLN